MTTTIQLTSQRIKYAIMSGVVLFLLGIGSVIMGDPTAKPLMIIGAGLYIGGKILAWWRHA